MDLKGITKEELVKNNYFYDSIDDVADQIIQQFVKLDRTLNNQDLLHSEKLFMTGLNKLMIDKDEETGYVLVKAYADWKFGKNTQSVNEYRPGNLFLFFAMHVFVLGKEVDFHTGNIQNFDLYKSKLRSVIFLQNSYFSKLAMFDNYDSKEKSQIAINELKEVGEISEKYCGINNPNQFLAKVLENKDVKTFNNIVSLFNQHYNDNKFFIYNKLPSENAVNNIQILAKDADYGKFLSTEDCEEFLPEGKNQNNLKKMFVLHSSYVLDKEALNESSRNIAHDFYDEIVSSNLN